MNAVAQVALPNAVYDYAVPPALRAELQIGDAVVAPLGPRRLIGYVTQFAETSPHKLRPLISRAEGVGAVPPDLMHLARFVADYYFSSFADALRVVVPSPVRRKVVEKWTLTKVGKKRLVAEPDHPLAGVTRFRTVRSTATALRMTQTEGRAQLDSWVNEGLIAWSTRLSETRAVVDDGAVEVMPSNPRVQLNDEQMAAVNALCASLESKKYATHLIEGVTGSGKTEVYLAVIEAALKAGGSAIVLVPEIGLTPQVESRFRGRLGPDVVTIHSGLSQSARKQAWQRVTSGEARVVVGPRSALFAPLHNLRVIVVDEEHDESYKQDENPRYHARDMALVRAHSLQALCVLGTATPSLETLHNVALGKVQRSKLLLRAANAQLPTVEIVELAERVEGKRVQRTAHQVSLFSERLSEAVRETVGRGEQAIIFLNRRGFAPFVSCQSCKHTFKCGECSVALTHHLRKQLLLCHYCGHTEPPPIVCPMCQSPHLRTIGTGTERLEIELKNAFPSTAIGRLDRDIADDPKVLHATLAAFRAGQTQILVGTQMVTKGHDFPNVTLVGVVFADAGLNFPDFRAAERTAQMLVQVAGRAGRSDRAGRVLVQTRFADHPAIIAASNHDYAKFAQAELAERQQTEWPPFARLLLIRVEGPDQAVVTAIIAEAARRVRECGEDCEVLGPSPCPLERLRGDYRVMAMVRVKHPAILPRVVQRSAFHELDLPSGTKLVLDRDPVTML